MIDWSGLILQGGFAVVLGGVLWYWFKAQQRTSQREQDRADDAQAYLQKMVDSQTASQAQTLEQMQHLTREAIQSTALVANTLAEVERAIAEHRKESQEAARVAATLGGDLIHAMNQVCNELDKSL